MEFLSDKVEGEMEKREDIFCSYALTKDTLVHQQIFICDDCSNSEDEYLCCCAGCANSCHKGHNVRFVTNGRAYCDCHKSSCDIIEKSIQECMKKNMTLSNVPSIPSPLEMVQVHTFPNIGEDGHVVELAKQCKILASLSKNTFWVQRDSTPRTVLEKLALDIYNYHMKNNGLLDRNPASGGCEFWVQVKPTSKGVDMHYDKDEEIAELMGIGVYPLISTVTYLSEIENSSATIVLNKTSETELEDPIDKCAIIWPSIGKHLAFNGSLLHGAPKILDLDEKTEEEEEDDEEDEEEHLRITFLVNLWIDHKPCGVNVLSDPLVNSLNSHDSHFFFSESSLLALSLEQKNNPETIILQNDTSSEKYEEKTIPFLSKSADWATNDDEIDVSIKMNFPFESYDSKNCYIVHYESSTCAYLEQDVYSDVEWEEEEEAKDNCIGEEDVKVCD